MYHGGNRDSPGYGMDDRYGRGSFFPVFKCFLTRLHVRGLCRRDAVRIFAGASEMEAIARPPTSVFRIGDSDARLLI